MTDEAGRTTRYGYFAGGKLEKIRYSDRTEECYSYDGNGNVRTYTNKEGYVSAGRAERVIYPDGKEVGYTYGKAGERRSLAYPDGRTVFYGYDEEIRLPELKEGDAAIRYGYDEKGRLAEKHSQMG